METVFTSSQLRSRYIARTLLFLLITWFALPEAKPYTPHFDPKFDRHFEQTIFLQLEPIKYNPGDNAVKQPGFVSFPLLQQPEQKSQSKYPVFCFELNAYRSNSYYVHNTSNAP